MLIPRQAVENDWDEEPRKGIAMALRCRCESTSPGWPVFETYSPPPEYTAINQPCRNVSNEVGTTCLAGTCHLFPVADQWQRVPALDLWISKRKHSVRFVSMSVEWRYKGREVTTLEAYLGQRREKGQWIHGSIWQQYQEGLSCFEDWKLWGSLVAKMKGHFARFCSFWFEECWLGVVRDVLCRK